MRWPMSVPRVTSLLAPSSKDVMFSLATPRRCCDPSLGRGGRTVLGSRRRRSAGRRRGGPRPAAGRRVAGSTLEAVEQVGVAAALGVEQVADPRLEVLRGHARRGCGTRLVAEDGLEQLLAEHRGAAGDAGLGPGSIPPVWAKTTTISATASPLTPYARKRAVPRLSAPSVRTMLEHVLLPVADRALGAAAEVARGAAEVLAGVREQRLAGGQTPARTRRRARRPPRRARGSASRARTRPRR